jgi:predicted DNA-binding transcriptional regulator AlpA
LSSSKIVVPAVAVEEPYETADAIAARLHVKRGTVYDWASRRQNPIPAKRISNKVTLFVWSEVRQWVEQGGTLRRRKAA